MNIVSLREAKALSLPRYYTGLPCGRGHFAERRTKGRTCIVCDPRKTDGTTPAPRIPQPADWPLERDAELTRMVEVEGRTFSAIGIALGITKNAAIGRAHRMGLEHPNAPAKPAKLTTMMQRLDALDLFPSSGECVFPLGHPKDTGFRFCGEPGAPYCNFHRGRAYLPEKTKSGGVFVFGRAAE